MALTDKQRRHLERRLREERGQIGRILDRYQDFALICNPPPAVQRLLFPLVRKRR